MSNSAEVIAIPIFLGIADPRSIAITATLPRLEASRFLARWVAPV